MHALQPLSVEDVAAEKNGPAEPVPAEQGPVDELVTDVTSEEDIAPEESSQPQLEVETPEPEAVEPTPGEELSGETQPEDEGAEAEAPPEFTPTPQREMPQPRSITGHAGRHAIGSWVGRKEHNGNVARRSNTEMVQFRSFRAAREAVWAIDTRTVFWHLT